MGSTTQQKPKLILVPGAWHWEFHTDKWVAVLKKMGYDARALTLTNVMRWSEIDTYTGDGFEDTVEKVLNTFRAEAKAGRDFVSIGHSASGLINAEAINRFLQTATPEEKVHCKYHILIGSFLTMKHAICEWHYVEWDKMLMFPVAADRIFYNDMTLQDAAPFVAQLCPMLFGHSRPSDIATGWKEIPTKYILCEQDAAYLPEWSYAECEEFGLEYVKFDGGHCPMVSQPENFSQFLHELLVKEKVVVE